MVRIDASELESFARGVVESWGTPTGIASDVAVSLVGADLTGHGSHGVRRLATLYPDMIAEGALVPDARPDVDAGGAVASVDGNLGWGHSVGARAMDLAVERAAEAGVAVVGVRNATHVGRVGHFAERAADEGFVAVCLTNTGGRMPMVAPPGSADRRISTNPYAIGVPTYDVHPFPIVLDTAMCHVAHGKIMKRHLAGESMPDDWAVSATGDPLTDPAAFEAGEGAILPLGGLSFGYKGAGLSMAAELLVGLVGGGAVLGSADDGYVNNGAAFVVVDPEQTASRGAHREKVEAFTDHLRATDFREDVPVGGAYGDHALLPGEPEYERRTERLESGVPVDSGTADALAAVAEESEVDPPETLD